MYAVLHVPNFSLQAILRTEAGVEASETAPLAVGPVRGRAGPPDPPGWPPPRAASQAAVALLANDKRKALILSATAPALALSVEPGLTAAQALARCPQLTFRTPNASAETEARAVLLTIGFILAPLLEDTAPGVCTADCQGLNPSALIPAAERALQELDSLGLSATFGAGSTPLLAHYAACEAARNVASPTPSSRILVVKDAPDFLRDLPLAVASPSAPLQEILVAWGLRTLGDLTALSCEDVARRLGQAGVELWRRAAGGQPRPLHAYIPTPTFSAAMDFEDALETLEPLLFILKRLLDRLALDLSASHLVASEAILTLPLANETSETRVFRLPEPTGDAEIIFRAVHIFLEALRTTEAIAGIRLQLMPVRPLVRQTGLFETGLRDPHGFGETLARIAALVGGENVGAPQLTDTHRPDTVKLGPPPAVIPPPQPAPVWPEQGLPLRRFRPPLDAKLELTDGQPTYVWTPRFAGNIAAVRGPWCGSGDWWQSDRLWKRTEWDISLAQGGIYRLLLSQNTYAIEGEYD